MQLTMPRTDVTGPPGAGALIKPATVERRDGNRYLVTIHGTELPRQIWARACLTGQRLPDVGDRVLLAGEDDNTCYVVGILATKDGAESGDRVATAQGASAAVIVRDGEQCIEVRDTEQRLVFEYRPGTGQGSLTMPQGDLALNAPHGNIDLISGRSIRCFSEDALSLQSAHSVHVGSQRADGTPDASLTLQHGQARLAGERIRVEGEQGEFSIGKATYEGRRLAVTVERVRMVMDRVETVAVRVIERAHDAYRYVQNLDLLKSGRSRRLVKNSYHVQSERVVIGARKDVKVRGEKIHLG